MGRPLNFQPAKCIESVLTIEIAKPKLWSLRSGCAARFRVGGKAEPQLRLCQHYLPLLSLPFVKFYMNVSRRMRQIYSRKFSLSLARSLALSLPLSLSFTQTHHAYVCAHAWSLPRVARSQGSANSNSAISSHIPRHLRGRQLPLAGIAIRASLSERAPFAGLST
jgi:hypothetical protein